jgi:valyl-tRNA synthetase
MVRILLVSIEKTSRVGSAHPTKPHYQGRWQNPNFVNKAPEPVVEGARNALAEAEKQAQILRDRLEQLGNG